MQASHAILIAGMHRSGTSAFARVTNLLGAELGDGLTPASPANPRGFWEQRTIVELNEECLNSFGLAWDDPSPLPADWLQAPWLESWSDRLAAHLHNTHSTHQLFAIKDPRICRLLPVWMQVLDGMGITPHIVLAARDPLEVCASLMRRDQMSATLANRLWLAHVLDAEYHSRGASRTFVTFSELLAHWQSLAERMQQDLEIVWPNRMDRAANAVEDFLSAGMHHSASTIAPDASPLHVGLLANTVFAYTQANAANARVPDQCWDEARDTFTQQFNARADKSQAHFATEAASIKGSLTHWEPVELISELVQARLYYRQDQQPGNENDHLAVPVSTSVQPMHAKFELPPSQQIDFVRFDPAMHSGIFRILEVIVNGQSIPRDAVRVATAHERLLPPEDGVIATLFSSDNDPHVELDLRQLDLPQDGSRQVEFIFECDSLFARIDRISTQHRQVLSDAINTAQRSIDQSAVILDRIKEHQHTIRSHIGELSESVLAIQRSRDAELQCQLRAAGWLSSTSPSSVPRNSARANSGNSLKPTPSRGLQPMAHHPGSNAFCWQTSGHRSFFTLQIPDMASRDAGWHLLEMYFMPSHDDFCQPTLEILCRDSEHQIEESTEIVPLGHASILFHCRSRIQNMYFNPGMEAQATFLLSLPRLQRVSRTYAFLRLARSWARHSAGQGNLFTRACKHGWSAYRRGGTRAVLEQLLAMQRRRNNGK